MPLRPLLTAMPVFYSGPWPGAGFYLGWFPLSSAARRRLPERSGRSATDWPQRWSSISRWNPAIFWLGPGLFDPGGSKIAGLLRLGPPLIGRAGRPGRFCLECTYVLVLFGLPAVAAPRLPSAKAPPVALVGCWRVSLARIFGLVAMSITWCR